MTDIIVKIVVEVLTVLAIATEEIKRGRISELNPHWSTTVVSDLLRKVLEETEWRHGGRG